MFKKIQRLNEKQKETVKDLLSSYILTSERKQKLAVRGQYPEGGMYRCKMA